MKALSTKNLNSIPKGEYFQKLCKSISAIEAIVCQEWEYRYFSYNKDWSELEECCEMRNGEGDQMLILFNPTGIVINGFAHESQMNGWRTKEIKKEKTFLQKLFKSKNEKQNLLTQNIWEGVTAGLPKEFEEFIFGEPIKSIGTTFCIWQKHGNITWQIGSFEFPNDDYLDGSADLLKLLDGYPTTYKDWAKEYYEDQFNDSDLDLESIRSIYDFNRITKKIVLKINPRLEDFNKLGNDLDSIGYPHEL